MKLWRVTLSQVFESSYSTTVEVEAETEEEAKEMAIKIEDEYELDWEMSYDTECTGDVEIFSISEIMGEEEG